MWREAPGLASRSLIILIGQPRYEKQADCAETNWKLTRLTPRKMFYHVIPIWIELAFDKDQFGLQSLQVIQPIRMHSVLGRCFAE